MNPATTKLLCAGRRQRTDLAERGHLLGRLLLLPPPGGYIKGPSDPAAQSGTDSTRRRYSRPPSNKWLWGRGATSINWRRWQEPRRRLPPDGSSDPASLDHRPPVLLIPYCASGWRENRERTYITEVSNKIMVNCLVCSPSGCFCEPVFNL